MLANLSIADFLEKTAAGEPVPGGGSAAALAAAVAASLVEMVANLTIGKKGFETVEAEMKEIASIANEYRKKLAGDIDRDSAAFDAVMTAFRLPQNAENEKAKRKQAIQEALKTAATVPLEVAQNAYHIMQLAETAVKKGNKAAVTDAAVAALMAGAAVFSALYNVRINLGSIEETGFVFSVTEQVKSLETAAESKEKETMRLIIGKINLIGTLY